MLRRCLAIGSLVLGLVASIPHSPAMSAGSTAVVHRQALELQTTVVDRDQRIVWDAKLNGIELYSARLDGSDRVLLWKQAKGDLDNLVLSPDERRVAFSPDVRRGRPARLLSVATADGQRRDLLSRRNELVGIGPIGWTPNGRRIIFQGFVDEPNGDGNFYPSYLYSVSSTGGDLRKGRKVSDGTDNGAVFGSILVTARGIIYPDDYRILRFPSLTKGKPVVVARRASIVQPTGDGKWLYFRHVSAAGKQSLRVIRPNGRDERVVYRFRDDLQDLFLTYAPDTTGRYLFVSRPDPDNPAGRYGTVVLDTETMAAAELPFVGGAPTLTW